MLRHAWMARDRGRLGQIGVPDSGDSAIANVARGVVGRRRAFQAGRKLPTLDESRWLSAPIGLGRFFPAFTERLQ